MTGFCRSLLLEMNGVQIAFKILGKLYFRFISCIFNIFLITFHCVFLNTCEYTCLQYQILKIR